MNAVIYARFSSDRQNESSIDAQVRACREYAISKNIIVLDTYVDEAISGTTANRTNYQRMLADAFDGRFDCILIHKYDRIARDLEEQVTLSKRLKQLNIKLIAVAQDYGEGKDADLSRGIQWVLGEYYSANLSEEVKKGHKETALKALHNGGVAPFGYDVIDQKYNINEAEAYYVRWMFRACLNGEKYKNIIDSMSAAGIVGKRGKPIKYPQIYEILHNEKYTGTYIYSLNEELNRSNRRTKPNAIRIENALPAIIDKDTFDQAQNIMASRTHSGHVKHRCSGIVYCSECGSKMHFYHTERKGHKYNTFKCSGKCGAHCVPADKIDSAVDKYIEMLFDSKNKEIVERAIINLSKYNSNRSKDFEKDKIQKIDKKEKELNELLNALMSGAFNDNYDYCNELISQKRKEIEELKNLKLDAIPDTRIKEWLQNIIESNYTPKAFIDRIEVNTTEVKIISTFSSVVGNNGCGGRINIFPQILYGSISCQDRAYRRSDLIQRRNPDA